MNSRKAQLEAFDRLLTIMDELREQCPWDRKQTMESLRHLTIEEVYELGDAILDEDLEEVKKELGDVFLHLVFYSKIGAEKAAFDVADVLNEVCDKLVHRHPHIYGDIDVEDEEEVKRNWEKLKLKEGKKSVLEGVPKSLPAMVKAYRMQEKAKGVGFEFDNSQDVLDKIQEEMAEFETASDPESKEKEMGDILFSIVNYARYVGINPENALERTNQKFIRRFQKMEELSAQRNLIFNELSLAEQDQLWNETKKEIQ